MESTLKSQKYPQMYPFVESDLPPNLAPIKFQGDYSNLQDQLVQANLEIAEVTRRLRDLKRFVRHAENAKAAIRRLTSTN
jgi:hypothetical protein